MRKVGDLRMEHNHFLVHLDDKATDNPYKLSVQYWANGGNHRKLVGKFADYHSVIVWIGSHTS